MSGLRGCGAADPGRVRTRIRTAQRRERRITAHALYIMQLISRPGSLAVRWHLLRSPSTVALFSIRQVVRQLTNAILSLVYKAPPPTATNNRTQKCAG